MRSSRQAEHLAFARAERANIDAALAWSAAHDPLLALDIVNGFGWAWIVLGDSRGAQRILAALDAAGDAAPARDRAGALLLAAWIEASTGHLELAREHIAAATELADAIGDVDLQARCCYYLAYVVSHHGEWAQALELTDRSRALYDGLDRPWDQAANWLFAARAAISAGDRGAQRRGARPGPALAARSSTTRGSTFAATRCSASWPASSTASTTPSLHIGRAAETSRRLGFLQTEAYQVSSLGRAQCQAGDYDDRRRHAGARDREGRGHRRRTPGGARPGAPRPCAAGARTGDAQRGPRSRRRPRGIAPPAAASRPRSASACWRRWTPRIGPPAPSERLVAILDEARGDDDAHVEVFALDALARIAAKRGDIAAARGLCEAADRRMEAASHFITELDRTDARAVRQIA